MKIWKIVKYFISFEPLLDVDQPVKCSQWNAASEMQPVKCSQWSASSQTDWKLRWMQF